MPIQGWLLSNRWQLTVQLLCGVLISALTTVIRPIYFPHACLAPVFAVIIIASLAQDQHIGSRLQVTALLLGPTWLAVVLAGFMVTLAKLAEDPKAAWTPQYIAAVCVLSVVGLAVLITVRAAAPPGPARLMGVLAALMYGIIVLLGVVYSSLASFWLGAVGFVVLAMVVASGVSLLVGGLVAPSLASDQVAALASEALQGAGAIISYHTSLLMAERQQQDASSKDRDSSTAQPGTKGDLHLKVTAGRAAALQPKQHMNSALQQHSHGHTLWPQHQAHILRHKAGGHDRQHHQHLTAPAAIDAAVDAVSAAVAVHRASLEQHGPRGTLDWVVDDPDNQAGGAAAAAAGLQRQAQHIGDTHGLNSQPQLHNSSVQAVAGGVAAHAGSADHAGPHSIHSTGSEHSTGGSEDELDDLDSIIQLQRRSREQQQDAEQLFQQPRLDEQLLQDPALSPLGGDATAAWVAAATAVAASRQASLMTAASLDSQDSLGPFAAAADGGSAAHRKSLEHAASLEFQPEMDDKSFLELMRVMSRSKPYGSTASLDKLATTSRQPPPPAKSAASAASTAGSVIGRPSTPAVCVLEKQQQEAEQQQQQQAGLFARWRRSLAARSSNSADDTALDDGPGAAGRSKSHGVPSFMRGLSSASFWLQPKPRQQVPVPTHKQQRQPSPQTAMEGVKGSGVWNDTPCGTPTAAAAPCGCEEITAAAAVNHTQGKGSQVHFALELPKPASSKVVGAASRQHNTSQRQPSTTTTSSSSSKLQTPPTTAAELGPIIAAAKAALASARFEPSWLRPSGFACFSVDAWTNLLEDAELLLVRVSTLEALSEERQMQELHLHDLQHYNNMADAMALTLAQLSAFLADVSQALARQQTNRYVPTGIAARLGWQRKPDKHSTRKQGRQQQQALLRTVQTQQQQQQHGTRGPPSPFAAAAAVAAAAAGDQRGHVVGQPSADVHEVHSTGQAPSLSAILSGLERQGSGVSSYLWEKKTGWETGRHLLQHEMEAAVGAYWWAVRRASKKAPVKVPRSREVMILTFVYPICTGLIDASERLEASAQRVLRGVQYSSSKTSSKCNHTGQSRFRTAAAAAAAGDGLQCVWNKLPWCTECVRSAWQEAVQREQQWLQPLMRLLLVQPGLQAMRQVVMVGVPSVLSSRQSFVALLKSRSFQAGFKLYLAAGTALVATVLLMAYVPKIRSIVPMFGFTSVCLSMQERVEATTDKVVGRVLGTIVGASLGLGIDYIPDIFNSPVLLLVCLGGACILLGVIARAQARTSVALAILTLLSVSLCTYESACCTPGVRMSIVDVFLGRMGAVVGACIYVAILNRVLLPWYTSNYAMEQMADALERAAELFERIYASQHNRMRVAAIAAGAVLAGDDQQNADTFRPTQMTASASAADITAAKAAATVPVGRLLSTAAAATAELAALEAAEATLHVALRQEVLSRLIAVQVSLAKESVSWKRGVLATPQVVLDVLGALIECVEALASQRLALAPFTKQEAPAAVGGVGGHGLLRLSGHCYSIWAAPLHPCWMKTLTAVQELAKGTAQHLRRLPSSNSSNASGAASLQQKLLELEHCRLELRHTWLDIRRQLHKQVHDESQAQGHGDGANTPHRTQVWPTDSIHFFTFTYGASRVLNKLAGVAQAVLSASDHQTPA